MSTVAEVATQIEKIVGSWWATHHAPLLLSKLGALLPPDTQSFFRLDRIPLKRFIEENLRSEVRLVSLPRFGAAAVPSVDTADASDSDLYHAFDSRRTQVVTRRPRYGALIWEAFKTPLADGRRRFIRVSDDNTVEVQETDVDAPEGDAWIEVASEDLGHLSKSGFVSGSELDEAIRSWSEGKIEVERLLYHPHSRSHASLSRHSYRDSGTGTLESVIGGLRVFTPEELKRIQIPADVVVALLERSTGTQ
jgi:hypothetical protein